MYVFIWSFLLNKLLWYSEKQTRQAKVAHSFNPSSREAVAGKSLWVQSQSGLQSEFKEKKGLLEKPCLKTPEEKRDTQREQKKGRKKNQFKASTNHYNHISSLRTIIWDPLKILKTLKIRLKSNIMILNLLSSLSFYMSVPLVFSRCCQAWWYMSIILEVKRLRQEGRWKFEGSKSYTWSLSQNKRKKLSVKMNIKTKWIRW